MGKDLLHRLALLGRRKYRWVFTVTAVLLGASLFLARDIEFDTEVLNLLPQDDVVIQTFRDTLDEFGSLDFLLVVVRIPEDAVADPYEMYAEELGQALGELEEIEYVDYRLGEIEELVETFFPKALLFLDEEGRRGVEERLSDSGIRNQIQELRRQIHTPQSLALRRLHELDPLGLAEYFVDRLTTTRGALKIDWSRGYFLSQDHRLLLLVAKPVAPAQDLQFDRRLTTAVDGVIAEVASRWGEIVGPQEDLPAPEVALGGSYITALDDATYVRRDIVINAVTAMGGVLLLFLFAFRRVGLLLYAFVPLSCGLILAFAFAAEVLGGLNAATSGFAALLVGLGIDFVIVSYGRYVEERGRGAALEEALWTMSGSCGRAVVTGGVTTAATFYAFASTKLTGLRQMGFLVGTGILFCMVAVLVLLPAMLAWSDDRHQRLRRAPTLFLHGLGTGRLIHWSLKRPWIVLALGTAVSVVCALLALRLEFVDTIRTMRPEGNRGIAVQEEVARHFGSGFDYMMLVVSGASPDEVLSHVDAATQLAQRLVEDGELNGIDSITSLVPPPRRQSEVLTWLHSRGDGALDQDRIRDTFTRSLESEGLRLKPFLPGLELFESAMAARQGLSMEDFVDSEQTRHLLDRYLRKTDDGWKSVVYLYPPPEVWKRQAPPGVKDMARALGPNVVVTGVNIVSETVRTQVRKDAVWGAVLGFVLVALLLWLDYRNLGNTLLSLAPLLVGIVWMLGGMALLDIDMNFFNIFVTTMIIGIGVDYGVHIMHRYQELSTATAADLERGLRETGKAIVLASLSTMVGFGSMSLSHYPGLRSMGWVAILGALSTAVVAITLLPAFLGLRLAWRKDAPSRQSPSA